MKNFNIISGRIGSGKTTLLTKRISDAKEDNKKVIVLDTYGEHSNISDENSINNTSMFENMETLLKYVDENPSEDYGGTLVFIDEGYRTIEDSSQMKKLIGTFDNITATFHSPPADVNSIVERVCKHYALKEEEGINFSVEEAKREG